MNAKISIIVPAYNVADTIERTIGSLVDQTLSDIEIVAVDDCSEDNTATRLETMGQQDPRIRIIRNSNNKGTSVSRKLAILAASGQYIMFVDAGDELHACACMQAYGAIRQFNADVLQFGTRIVDDGANHANVIWMQRFLECRRPGRLHGSLVRECFEQKSFGFTLWNKIYQAQAVKHAAENIPDVHLIKGEDLLLQLLILSSCQTFYSISEELYTYYYGSGITGNNLFSTKKLYDHMQQSMVVEAIYNYLKQTDALAEFAVTLNHIAVHLIEDNLATLKFCTGSDLEIRARRFFLESWGDGNGSHGKYFDNKINNYLQPAYNKINTSRFKRLISGALTSTTERELIDDLTGDLKSSISSREGNPIPVVMICNEAYLPYLAVAVESIKENSSGSICLIVLYTRICSRLIERVKSLATTELSIDFLNISVLLRSDPLYEVAHFSQEMYYRLYIPELLSFLPKAIYLDCDIVVLGDLRQLYEIEMGDHVVAAAANPQAGWIMEYARKLMGTRYKDYFNSGVILFNTSRYIEHNIRRKCLAIVEHGNQLACPDQDAMNLACSGLVKIIDKSWNYQWQYSADFDAKHHSKERTTEDKLDYTALTCNISILHFDSHLKPWNKPAGAFAEVFWTYAKKSPFFMDIICSNLNLASDK